MDKIRVLHILGIDDSDTIEVAFLSPDPANCAYTYLGNVDALSLLDRAQFEVLLLICGGIESEGADIPPVDLMMNAICDPDTNAKTLEVAATLEAQLGVPTINPAERVLQTSRDGVSRLLAGIPGLRVPTTARIVPEYRRDVLPMAEAAGVRPPFLLREVGAHGGKTLTLVEDGTPLDELDKYAFDGRVFYATEFVDFRSPDGLYRKYRVIFIDGVPYPRHMVAARTWNIHLETSQDLMGLPELQHEKERFLATFATDPPPAFQEVVSAFGLDYFGMDFAVVDDGTLVLFEANCCFRLTHPSELEQQLALPEAAEARAQADARLGAALADLFRKRVAMGHALR